MTVLLFENLEYRKKMELGYCHTVEKVDCSQISLIRVLINRYFRLISLQVTEIDMYSYEYWLGELEHIRKE